MKNSVNELASCDNSRSFVESISSIPQPHVLRSSSLIFMEEQTRFVNVFSRNTQSILIGVERYSAYQCYRFHIHVPFAFVLMLNLHNRDGKKYVQNIIKTKIFPLVYIVT